MDQFKFIYQTLRTMYMSAVRDLLLAEDPYIVDVVIPNLAAFRAIRQGRDILLKKKLDGKKLTEKIERE